MPKTEVWFGRNAEIISAYRIAEFPAASCFPSSPFSMIGNGSWAAGRGLCGWHPPTVKPSLTGPDFSWSIFNAEAKEQGTWSGEMLWWLQW